MNHDYWLWVTIDIIL